MCRISNKLLIEDNSPKESAVALDVPIQIEIINSRDAASILVRIIYMLHVMTSTSRITSHHSLKSKNTSIQRRS